MRRAILVLGVFALISQVLCLRELAVAFHGTELYFGATLAAWMLLTALGSSLLGRVADRFLTPVRWLAAAFVTAGIILPGTVILLRWAPRLLPVRPGAVVPYWQMCLATLPTLAPLCLLIGFAFALACRTARPHASSDASAIARAYIIEAAGTVVGGVLFSYALVHWLPAVEIAAGAGLLMVVTGWLLTRRQAPPGPAGWLGIAAPALVLMALLLPPVGRTVDFVSKTLRMPGYVLLESRETPYGQLDVGLREEQRVFFADGAVVASTEDIISAEEVAHIALLAHPEPKDVLLVGGGPTGVAPELLKHASVRRIDYVELDPALVRLTAEYGARLNRAALASDWVTIHARIDGRGYLQRTDRRFDVIILDQPDPITAVTNRLYTLECFRAARRALTEHGVLMVHLTGAPGYMSRELRVLSASILKTLEEAFEGGGVRLVACDGVNYFLASPVESFDLSPETLADRYAARGLDARWLTARMLTLYASPRRTRETLAMIRSADDAALNTDQRPITYYYAMLFRNRLFQRGDHRAVWERLTLAWVGGLVFLLIVGAVIGGFAAEQPRRVSVPAALLGAGFCGLAFEMVLILAFQSLAGIAYSFMAMLFAAFMAGLALGGAAGQWAGKRGGAAALVVGLAGLAAGGVLAPMGLDALVDLAPELPLLGLEAIFVGGVLIVGLLVGGVFASGVHLYRGARGAVARTAGTLYAMDLIGACCGALLVTALLIPVLGLAETCYAATLVALGALAQFVISERRG